MGHRRFVRKREVSQRTTAFMDPKYPRSYGGKSQNGPAAEVEPAHSKQDSSQFQTPGTVNSRRGIQTSLPSSPPSTIQKNLAELAEELKIDESSAMTIEHAKSCNGTRMQNFSVTELTTLKPKHKDVWRRMTRSRNQN